MRIRQKNDSYRLFLPAILLLLAAALTACSSAFGATPTKSSTPPSSSPPPTTDPAASSSGGTRASRQGASGTLASISGNNLVLITQQGQVTVVLNSSTVIEQVIMAAIQDLTTGQFITITGDPDSTGTIVATDIMVRPASQTSSFTFPTGTPPNFGGRQFGSFNGTGAGSPSGNFTRRAYTGIISAISGSTLTITTSQSTLEQVAVEVGMGTTIQETISASINDLTIGTNLSVFGNTNANGSIDAVSITEGQAGRGFRFVPGPGQ